MGDQENTAKSEGYVLQIKKIGNSTGLIFPKELLARLKLAEGDKLHVVEQTERGLKPVRMIPSMRKRWRSRGDRSVDMPTPTARWRNERAGMARH